MKHKIPVLLFSLEMSKYELMERMLAGEARIDSSRIKRGFLEYSDWKNKIHPASGRLAAAPILIDDSSAISIMEIRAKARRFRGDPRYFPPPPPATDGHPPAPPLGPDHRRLPSARASGGQRPPRREPPAGDRRHLARPQVAGQGSQGADHRHLAAEPRGREARGQAAALRPARIGQHRAGRRHGPLHPPRGHGGAASTPTTEPTAIAEIIIGKHRNGGTGAVKMTFIKEYTRFENYADDAEPGWSE